MRKRAGKTLNVPARAAAPRQKCIRDWVSWVLGPRQSFNYDADDTSPTPAPQPIMLYIWAIIIYFRVALRRRCRAMDEKKPSTSSAAADAIQTIVSTATLSTISISVATQRIPLHLQLTTRARSVHLCPMYRVLSDACSNQASRPLLLLLLLLLLLHVDDFTEFLVSGLPLDHSKWCDR